MNKKIIFTVITTVILGGAGYMYLRALINNNEKYAKRISELFDDGGDKDNDSNN